MQALSQASEYAIRALTYLAQHESEGFLLVRRMSAELNVPSAYLTKVLQPFVARGVLESQRGRGSGFRLVRPPAEVTLYEIIEAHEPVWQTRRCSLGQADCSDERACPLHEPWKRTSEAFLARLTHTSLADVMRFCKRRPASGYPLPGPRD